MLSLRTSGLIAVLAVTTLFVTACQDGDTDRGAATPGPTAPERERQQSGRPAGREATGQPLSATLAAPTGLNRATPPASLAERNGQAAKGVAGLADDPVTVQRNRDDAAAHAPDNSGVNARDRNRDAVTPMDQSESAGDIAITAGIRRALISESRFSLTAKNIKIITNDGHVTLRGTVATLAESGDIARLASSMQGVREVTNALEVVL